MSSKCSHDVPCASKYFTGFRLIFHVLSLLMDDSPEIDCFEQRVFCYILLQVVPFCSVISKERFPVIFPVQKLTMI